MNELETRLKKIDPNLFSKLEETKIEVELLLGKYSFNFPDYTDHSIKHTLDVFEICAELLSHEEIENLNADEIYILSMASLLHDIGMCIPIEKIEEKYNSEEYTSYRESHPNLSTEEFIRDVHHELSKKFILEEWELLKIVSKKYALAIGLVAEGHRKTDLGNFEIYQCTFFPKNGKLFSCLPYLASVLRIADELDITNSRTPKLLTKYYMPNNEVSIREWNKHISTSQRNYFGNKVIFQIDCSDQNIYAALQDQFEKIQKVINYCQKIIRAIPLNENRKYSLNLSVVETQYNFEGFDPKGIKFSFDVQNVVTAFIGEDLYKDKLTSIREAIQNSIDSCRYKSKVLKENYIPKIEICFDEKYISVQDNGAGMDEFIIENFFGRLASSFYEQEKVKNQFEAIGQFGVGVFSYFLISEFVDIETKTISSNALKFRFDKDPKSYFHFYDKVRRKTAGTTISMFFKENLIGKIALNEVEDYVRKVFKHIEIPIEINSNQSKTKISSQEFEKDYDLEIKNSLKLQYRNIGKTLTTVSCSLDNEDFEGNCALIIGKNYLETFNELTNFFDREQFYTVSRHNSLSKISLSQKGVFVNNYNSSFIKFMLGDINLKKKAKINIDRNQFSDDSSIYNAIHYFEIEILEKLFKSLEKKYKDNSERLKISNNFLANYQSYYHLITKKLIGRISNILLNYIFVSVYHRGKSNICTMADLINKTKEIILISDRENVKEISSRTEFYFLTCTGEKYEGTYNSVKEILIHILGWTNSIINISERNYEIITESKSYSIDENDLKKLKNIFGHFYMNLIRATSKEFFVSVWINKKEFATEYYKDEFLFNFNHPFCTFILENYEKINATDDYKKVIKAAYKYLYELKLNSKLHKNSLKEVNDILIPLNSLRSFKKFTLRDF